MRILVRYCYAHYRLAALGRRCESSGGEFLTAHLSTSLRAAAFLSISISVLAGGCDPEAAIPASHEVSHALIGKRITVRGRFSLQGKVGPYVLLDNQQVIYLVPRGSFTWGKPYSEMEGKVVRAAGTLRFFHSYDLKSADQTMARPPDYFYFEAENAQVRLISP